MDAPPAASRPVTPVRGQSVNQADLLSTPSSNMGSASHAVSGGFSRLNTGDVAFWINNDLKNRLQCEVDGLLEYFLIRVGKIERKLVLETCKNAVKHICRNPDVIKNLKKYSETAGETARYPFFVSACNAALHELSKIKDITTWNHPSSLNIMFHISDPKVLHGTHDEASSSRKPDIVVVSLAAAQRAKGDVDDDWSQIVEGYSTSSPKHSFTWPDILSSQELKIQANEIHAPPSQYDVNQDQQPVPHMKESGCSAS